MLTQSLQKKFNYMFAQLDPDNSCMNLKELEGFMHAIVITPDIIQPSEWLPKIFNNQMPEYDSIKEPESIIHVLMDSYAYYNEIRLKGTLSYSYDVKQLNTEMFDDIMNWAWGFLTGLHLRMPIWTNSIVSKELDLDEDPVINSLEVIRVLVGEELNTSSIVKKMKVSYEESGEHISEDDLEIHIKTDLMAILPEAVSVLQTFGEGMDKRRKMQVDKSQSVRSNKIGRNTSCPCGSGKKYKKCCALTKQEGYLH